MKDYLPTFELITLIFSLPFSFSRKRKEITIPLRRWQIIIYLEFDLINIQSLQMIPYHLINKWEIKGELVIKQDNPIVFLLSSKMHSICYTLLFKR